jgi:ABC-type multidrug transport system ATPase subunit
MASIFLFQDPTLDLELTGRENLDFHGRIYGLEQDVRKQRIRKMLDIVKLKDRADDFVNTYSGGMKRRLEIARGLLHYPKILFLDEPTLGLDPQSRRAIWEQIQRLNQDESVTIILTTHYTEEADYLCNRIQIIDYGKIVALDTPDKLKARLEGDIISLTFKNLLPTKKIQSILEKKKWIRRMDIVANSSHQTSINQNIGMMRRTRRDKRVDVIARNMSLNKDSGIDKFSQVIEDSNVEKVKPDSKHLNLLVDDGGSRIPEIVKLVHEAELILESVEIHKPTLDDVFLTVTGRNIRQEQGSFMDTIRRHRIIRQARGARARS